MGAACAVGGIGSLLLALSQVTARGWGAPLTVVALLGSAALMVGFFAVERTVARPLIPPGVWRMRTLTGGTGVMFIGTGLLVGVVFLLSIYLQTALGYSAFRAGAAFLPLAAAVAVGTHVGGLLLGRLAPRSAAAVGFAAIAAGATSWAVNGTAGFALGVLPGMAAVGLGAGVAVVCASVTASSGVPAAHAGLASGFLMTGHELGAAVGVAAVSTAAAAAGEVATAAGTGDGFTRGAVACAVTAALAVIAVWRTLPAVVAEPGSHPVHMH
jgi:hypothetical protein